jgi:hypothetical protein
MMLFASELFHRNMILDQPYFWNVCVCSVCAHNKYVQYHIVVGTVLIKLPSTVVL